MHQSQGRPLPPAAAAAGRMPESRFNTRRLSCGRRRARAAQSRRGPAGRRLFSEIVAWRGKIMPIQKKSAPRPRLSARPPERPEIASYVAHVGTVGHSGARRDAADVSAPPPCPPSSLWPVIDEASIPAILHLYAARRLSGRTRLRARPLCQAPLFGSMSGYMGGGDVVRAA